MKINCNRRLAYGRGRRLRKVDEELELGEIRTSGIPATADFVRFDFHRELFFDIEISSVKTNIYEQLPPRNMPGRQSTLGPAKTQRRKQKPGKRRNLDALAIAEKQNPTKIRVQRHRLGEIEDDDSKHRRPGTAAHDFESSADVPTSKRRKIHGEEYSESSAEEGGDSEGNEWHLGTVNSDDDSNLDSDEAMGQSDEDKFKGFAFGGSTGSKKGGRKMSPEKAGGLQNTNLDLSEGIGSFSNGLDEESEDDLGEDGVDLATALDMNEADDVDEARDRTTKKDSHQQIKNGDENREDSSDDDDHDDESSALSISDDESNVDTSKLQQFVKSIQEDISISNTSRKEHNHAQEYDQPTEFGLNPTRKVTIADLLPSITNPHLRSSLKLLGSDEKPTKGTSKSGIPGKLEAPLPKRQQDKLDRIAAYEKSRETLNRWIETVKTNRRVEHILFPLADPDERTAPGSKHLIPTSSSKPMTDLESTIQNIMHESGLAESNDRDVEAQIQAFEELEANKLPIEEVQASRAELRRARDLLFREEVRAKRIKKIKSKSYRRVHRKQRERLAADEIHALAAAGLDTTNEERERNERRRGEERMGARHRESRWAKGVKDSGRTAWDEDARVGVTDMARRGDNLRKRIEGKRVATSEDLDSSSEEDEENLLEEDDESDAEARHLQRQLNRLGEEKADPSMGARDTRSTLRSMKFMQTAEASRKALNDAEIDHLRRDIADGDPPESDDDVQEMGRRKFGQSGKAKPAPAPTINTRSEFEESPDLNELANDGVPIDDHEDDYVQILTDKPTTSSHSVRTLHRSSMFSGSKNTTEKAPKLDVIDNPWLSGSQRNIQKSKGRGLVENSTLMVPTEVPQTSANSKLKTRPAVQKPIHSHGIKNNEDPNAKSINTTNDSSDDDDRLESEKSMPFVLRNEELVKKAFAGDEVFEDFSKEKEDAIEDEGDKVIDETLPGWGNWTGAGISKKEQKRNKGRFMTNVEGISLERRKDTKLQRVIISEKRVKRVCILYSRWIISSLLIRFSECQIPRIAASSSV